MAADRIAFIGLGQMGSAMAERLAEAGLDICAYDIVPAARARLAELGIPTADSIAAAVAGRNIILSSLPDSSAVRSAWLDEGGIVVSAGPGSLCIDLSTIDPEMMRTVAESAQGRQLAVVDCPVSGSPAEARQGKLILIAGGAADALEQAGPLLAHLGETCRHTGGIGTAKIVKIVNNMMSMGNVLVAAEAFTLGIAAGVEPQTLFDVLSVSGGRSLQFTKRFPKAIAGDFEPGFKMELGEKDLSLGLELARAVRSPAPAAAMIRELFAIALAEGFRGKDYVALLEMYRRWSENGGAVAEPAKNA